MKDKPFMHYMIFIIGISSDNESIVGELFCPFVKEGVEFQDFSKLFLTMDKIIEDNNIPAYDERWRTFNASYQEKNIGIDYVNRRGDEFDAFLRSSIKSLKIHKHMFFVEVMRRQNYTWQGKVTWIEKNKVKRFRSELELMKLIYNV